MTFHLRTMEQLVTHLDLEKRTLGGPFWGGFAYTLHW